MNQMILDFFNPNKPLTRIPIAAPCTSKINVPQDSESEDDEPKETGNGYSRIYEEQANLAYANAKLNPTTCGSLSKIDDIDDEARALISDLKNINMNKVYNDYVFDHYQRKEAMPIDSYKKDILSLLSSTSVVIIHGPTGCGKTTQVPQFIIDECREKKTYCNIVVTQPRKIAAISVAKRVCEERGWKLGTVCGYQVGLEKVANNETILSYVTTGVLLQKIANHQRLTEYTHIIVDEVHERTQEMDFVLLLLRRFLRQNSPDTKIILMSATFDTEKFGDYFRTHTSGFELPAPTIEVSTDSSYITTYYYLEQLTTLVEKIDLESFKIEEPILSHNLFDVVTKLIVIFGTHKDSIDQVTKQKRIGHVLIFLPGIYEIEEMYKYLVAKQSEDKKYRWLIIPLHSSITSNEQARVFVSAPPFTRKIILSTNIAESSITVPDIEYVIDFCLTKSMTVDTMTQYQTLKLEWASRVNCIQRSGRVGRVHDGTVYRMVPRNFYNVYLESDIKPEMLRAPLERIVLCAKLLDLYEPPKAILALAIDPPVIENIEMTILTLKEAGALLTTCRSEIMKMDGDLTFLGRVMSNLPFSVKLSKLVCLGHIFSCLEESIIMAAGCSLSNIFTSPFQEKLKTYISRLMWADGSCSDLIALLNLYRVWERNKRSGSFRNRRHELDWCQQNYISYRAIKEWKILVDEVKMRLKHMQIEEVVGPAKVTHGSYELSMIMKIVIYGAFYPNYFKRSKDYGQIDEKEAVRTLNGLSPMDTVYFSGMDMAQPGPLYAQRIKDLFKPLGTNMNVHFNSSSKVYVTFLNSVVPRMTSADGEQYLATIPGKISIDVYKAIKMRQIRMRTVIDVLRPMDAWKVADKLKITNRTEKKGNKERKNILPNLTETMIQVSITYIMDAGHFYVQLAHEVDKSLNLVDEFLNGKTKLVAAQKPKVGELYAIRFTDNRFYRCRVLALLPYKKNEIIANVIYVDYGETTTVKPKELYEIPKGPAKLIPEQSIECVLSEVRPSVVKNPKGLWVKQANYFFEKKTSNTVLTAKIYSVVNGVVAVELYKDINDISFNEWLVNEGFAEPTQESYLSQENHTKRKEMQFYKDESRLDELTDIDESYVTVEEIVEPPPLTDCVNTINLKGPTSPLEMKVYSVMNDAEALIEQGSVNSVLLDADPQDPHERMLVAPIVSQNQHNQMITIRHTTLLPNIHGLSTILTLVFAPTMIPKPVLDGTRFAAFLCGLGSSETTKKSIYPAHDMLMMVDTRIDQLDLNCVNELRYWMNTMVASMEDIYGNINPAHEIATCQAAVKERIFNLLSRPREPQERQHVKHANSWHKIVFNGELLLPGPRDTENMIWPLHWSMMLLLEDSERAVLVKHVEELREMATRVKPMTEITCNLCNVAISTLAEMRIHLSSQTHRENENEILKR